MVILPRPLADILIWDREGPKRSKGHYMDFQVGLAEQTFFMFFISQLYHLAGTFHRQKRNRWSIACC